MYYISIRFTKNSIYQRFNLKMNKTYKDQFGKVTI